MLDHLKDHVSIPSMRGFVFLHPNMGESKGSKSILPPPLAGSKPQRARGGGNKEWRRPRQAPKGGRDW